MFVAIIFYVSLYLYIVLISAVAKESFEEGYKAEYGKTLENLIQIRFVIYYYKVLLLLTSHQENLFHSK